MTVRKAAMYMKKFHPHDVSEDVWSLSFRIYFPVLRSNYTPRAYQVAARFAPRPADKCSTKNKINIRLWLNLR